MMKAREEATGVESANHVESTPRHEMWIAVQTKPNEQMSSESARVVADKIEGLVEQTTQGSFISHGRDDILTTAIGRAEHVGRVRGVWGSWSHQDFFGARSSRSSTVDSCSQEAMQRMEMQFEEKLKNIREEFEQKFELLARSQQQTTIAHDGVRVSTKGSCAAPDLSGATFSTGKAQAQVYGFIELQSIQKSGNTQVHIQQYMQTWMSESGRDIYMAPYIDGSHWQLMVIIPKEYTVVWFCSPHRKPSHEIKCQLQG
uniref:Ubiquitin-like protease family profile domain-containing protein n=1 Tax=Cajanus cajan TaxID=3821 RepID=A0A151RGF5_CAJCA|nr:hypothetical protein KK1_036979 [Cajanus cajan]